MKQIVMYVMITVLTSALAGCGDRLESFSISDMVHSSEMSKDEGPTWRTPLGKHTVFGTEQCGKGEPHAGSDRLHDLPNRVVPGAHPGGRPTRTAGAHPVHDEIHGTDTLILSASGAFKTYLPYPNETHLCSKNHTFYVDDPVITSTIDNTPELLTLVFFVGVFFICASDQNGVLRGLTARYAIKSVSILSYIARFTFVYTCIAPILLIVCIWRGTKPVATDSAFMLAGDLEIDDHDSRKYNKCRPYNGKKGTAFEIFARDFGAAMAGEYLDSNDMSSLEETMLGTDIGGDVYMAAGGNPAPTQVETRRRNKRLRMLYSHIYRHVTEPRLREMIASQANNDGRTAYQLLVRNCRERVTDLEMQALDVQFDGVSIEKDIGCSADSITLLDRLLCGLNARRPADRRKTDDQMTLKLLSCISHIFSVSLNMEAQKEIRAQPATRLYQDNGTNQRDYGAARDAFDDHWRAQFESGAIKPSPRHGVSGSVQADGSTALAVAETKTFSHAEIGQQIVCWCCRGFGHTKEQCPSKRGDRSIEDCIRALKQQLPEKSTASSKMGEPSTKSSDEKPADDQAAIAEVEEFDDGDAWEQYD